MLISSPTLEIWLIRAELLVVQFLKELLALRSRLEIALSILSILISIQSKTSSNSSAASVDELEDDDLEEDDFEEDEDDEEDDEEEEDEDDPPDPPHR